ncbi:PREDICTED: abnormal spindle-like microcephaly-associated protein homolog isoform X2 [Ipomoea nil]|uniref:abnormal spindle-like microcephaly-associated protein homolog isoform X2 n=1 Tax=Ipomoea nil TaxID=35883 RepID=UPI0009013BC2|nr:PREDICTED: abnormal spindle-like microcephaly-associated protein homolog isoform X2 [Ipomoea nil]
MDGKRQSQNLFPPSPSPSSSASSLLREASAFKTPRPPLRSFNFQSSPQFFTASKATPASSARGRRVLKSSAAKSKAARKLKAFELEQSKSARKALTSKEKSVKSLGKSLAVWLNFLFENPRSCGCDVSRFTGGFERSGDGEVGVVVSGKRESSSGCRVGVGEPWRDPKRPRNVSWRGTGNEETGAFPDSMFSGLKASLLDVCSFDDLKERMRNYLSSRSCKEIFTTMTQVAKNIDEGRLKMRVHCPMVTDVGMKEKALKTLMCYNPIWLRIGLYIILGGDSLLPNGDVNSEQEIAFLKMVIEKQFFSHVGLAKTYAYNKLVEGLFRPGYYEKLGNVILKRFLLLVLVLDRAKCQSSLPCKYGIDGLDGGSPLLFSLQSHVKSSNQLINEFLSSDVMHGEGNLLAHLVIIGFKANYQQNPLVEYQFKVDDIFEDLQDGVRLCRAVQLLQHDPSILMKMVVPSDTRKKCLINCGAVLQYVKQAGVPLLDEDGTTIMAEDVVNGDKELILSLLWNMFVHLQLPLLINKTLMAEEICKIQGVPWKYSKGHTHLDMLLGWIQAICESYDLKVETFSSLVDGKAMWCLLDFYFRKELHCSCSFKGFDQTEEVSIVSAIDYTDAVHNFILSQKLPSLLGKFPEVLQVSDILESNGACNDRSVVILLVFLSFQLLVKRNTDHLNFHKLLGFNCQSPERRRLSKDQWFMNSEADLKQEERIHSSEDATRNFKAIMSWWQEMAQRNNKCGLEQVNLTQEEFLTCKGVGGPERENAAKIIQSHFRRSVEQRRYMRIKYTASYLQAVIRAWLTRKKSLIEMPNQREAQGSLNFESENGKNHLANFGKYADLEVDGQDIMKLKKSVETQHLGGSKAIQDLSTSHLINAAIVTQKYIRGRIARSMFANMVAQVDKSLELSKENEAKDCRMKAALSIQRSWKAYRNRKLFLQTRHSAAIQIQSHYRGWLMRKVFINQKQTIIQVQSIFRSMRCMRDFKRYRCEVMSAITVQAYVRQWIACRDFNRCRCLIIKIQSHCRGWIRRKEFSLQKAAAVRIQSAVRCMIYWKAFLSQKHAATEMQRLVRGEIARKRLLGSSCYCRTSNSSSKTSELRIFLQSVVKIQRWWRAVLLHRQQSEKSAVFIQSHFRGWIARKRVSRQRHREKSAVFIQAHFRGWIARERSREIHMEKSAVVIQSYFRGWIARKRVSRERHRIVVIQSYMKAYLARKDLKGQLLDLRLRLQKSAANVNDGMRLINRLLAALSELLNTKSVSGILHTCATLDMATHYSQKCCEELVAAGAIDILLKLIRSVSRSIPDQEVLKHALSILRNLTRHPHLTEVLSKSSGSVEIILWELLRNKEEGYFIAAEVLKKLFLHHKGIEAAHKLPALVKRLHNHVEELSRKAKNDKRTTQGVAMREQVERRLREAVELLELIKTSNQMNVFF